MVNHPLHEMIHKLSHGDDIKIKKLHLDGISKKELNMMVSDALCMLPRHVAELSDCLYKKTAGSPLFAIGKYCFLSDTMTRNLQAIINTTALYTSLLV